MARLAAAGALGSARVPKTILSKVFLSDLLSKFSITMALAMVTCSPFFTGAAVTAAQVSPVPVFRRR